MLRGAESARTFFDTAIFLHVSNQRPQRRVNFVETFSCTRAGLRVQKSICPHHDLVVTERSVEVTVHVDGCASGINDGNKRRSLHIVAVFCDTSATCRTYFTLACETSFDSANNVRT